MEAKCSQKTSLTALADPVEVVEVAADVVPQPTATSVQHDAVLLAVVVVRLVLAPGWPLHDLAWNDRRSALLCSC